MEEEEESPREEVTNADEGEMLVLHPTLSTQKSEKDEWRVCSLIITRGSCTNIEYD